MPIEHGVFTRYRDTVPRPVTAVLSNAIALVASFPTYRLLPENVTLNRPVRLLGDIDDAKYGGPKTQGFTGPHALDAIRDNGGATVDIVNLFDPLTHKTTSTVSYIFTTNTIQLKRAVGATPTTVNAEGLTGVVSISGYVSPADYTVDMITGLVSRKTTGAIALNTTVAVTYTYADPAKITPAEAIGAVVLNQRTGLQALKDIFNLRGYKPKLILCPVFNENGNVATEMVALAVSLGAHTLLDAPAGVSRDEAIAGRAGTAPVGTFGVANRAAILCYPRVYASDGSLQPLSPYAVGVTAGVDTDEGYHYSPSNHEIKGIIGLELRLSADFTSSNTDVNALNNAGIVTVMGDAFGTGYRLWGNRSSLYPSDTTPLNFIAVSRTLDITTESLQRASLPYIDKPISTALIDTILAAGQAFLLEQVQSGALITGSEITWNKNNNLNSQLAAGRVTFNLRLMVPTPLETLIYESTLDISLLSNIIPTREAA